MEKPTLKNLESRITVLESIINGLQAQVDGMKTRDRGPSSTRAMTDEDARRIILGDLKGASHKEAASELGLSYGQIYSARGGYTFKHVVEETIKVKS